MQEVDGSIPFSSTISVSRGAHRDARGGAGPGIHSRWDPGALILVHFRRHREAPVMVFVLILLAAASRLLPHPPNFAPVAAIGLFAGATTSRRAAWLVPVFAVLASDLVLGFYHPVSMFWNYLAFGACLLLGSGLLARARGGQQPAGRLLRLAGAVLSSAVVFFLLSNFGVWASGYYPRTWAGLVECYTAALPFFRNTLASDVLYSAALFGGLAAWERWFVRPRAQTVRA